MTEQERSDELNKAICTVCPRKCRVDRKRGEKGVCGTSERILVSRASLHMWEEPCIAGEHGSGTVFFCGCNLHCVYCQNEAISHAKIGRVLSVEKLAELFLLLQAEGAENINLVTPTHYALQIKDAVLRAKTNGLTIPIVYNCSGYESVEVLRELDGIVDVYLTDFKYMEEEPAKRYSHAADYPKVAMEALEEMVRQRPEPLFAGAKPEHDNTKSEHYNTNAEDEDPGMMVSGVIVRHLLLPGYLENAKKIVKAVYERFGDRVYFSLMNQYTPYGELEHFPELTGKVTEEEYDELVDYAIELGVENGFIQEGETATESFIPDFDDEMILAKLC